MPLSVIAIPGAFSEIRAGSSTIPSWPTKRSAASIEACGGPNGLAETFDEMIGIDIPKGLYRDVKRAGCQSVEALALAQQSHQVGWRVVQQAIPVQPRQG